MGWRVNLLPNENDMRQLALTSLIPVALPCFCPFSSMILSLAVFSALLANVYMVISTILQSLNRNKQVYIVSGAGFLTNALLDVPLMLLLNYLGLNGFMGSICASIVGFSLSILLGIIFLKKADAVRFKTTFNLVYKSLIPAIIMYLTLFIVNRYFIYFTVNI